MWTTVLGKTTNFVKDHKNVFLMVLVALLLLAGGYGAGRYAQPAKVITKTVIQTVTETKIQLQDHIVYQKVYVQQEQKKTHTETVVTKKPDGETVTKTVEDTNTDTNTKTDEKTNETKTAENDTKTQQTVTQVKITEYKKMDWRVGLGAGVNIPTLLGHEELGIHGLKGAVIQAEVSRRLVGSLYLDLFGNTNGVVGLGLSLTL